MTGQHAYAVACSLVLLGAVAAQDRANPVPVRLTSEVYRGQYAIPDSVPAKLALHCELGGAYTSLMVQDADAGAPVILLLATEPAAHYLPGVGTFLVGSEAVPIGGIVGPDGTFKEPVDLARYSLAGQTLFVQALQLPTDRNPAALSEGLHMTFTEGNEQPPIGYTGPALRAIPCKAVDEYIETLYSVLLEFETNRYQDVVVVEVQDVDEETQAIVVQLVPNPNYAVDSPAVKIREVVDMGPFPKPIIEVWVAEPSVASATPAAAMTAPTVYDIDVRADRLRVRSDNLYPTLGEGWCGTELTASMVAPATHANGDVRADQPRVRNDNLYPTLGEGWCGTEQVARMIAPPGGAAIDGKADRRPAGDNLYPILPPGWCIVYAQAAIIDLRY